MLRSAPMATAHLIVSALVRRDGRILLVQQIGPTDREPTWMLPGGQVEFGESILEALGRELREETGLELSSAPRVAFVAHVLDGRDAYLALTFVCGVGGILAPADPDGYIIDAAWVDQAEALARLDRVAWYDSAPLRAHLDGDVAIAVSVVDRR